MCGSQLMGSRGSRTKETAEGLDIGTGTVDPIVPSNDYRIVPLEVSHRGSPPGSPPGHDSVSSASELGVLRPIQPSPILLTPRREDGLYTKISYTPVGDQLQVYKYYCPLCMSFYKDILQSSCCHHYICSECIVDYLLKRNHQVLPSLTSSQSPA
jgi:hypothetical protein